jgi:hypothetical protein
MLRYTNGVQIFLPTSRSADELREDRRRMARQIGLPALERNSRTVTVGNRRLKAWRVPGTPEFAEHARMVARMAEEFSRATNDPVDSCTDIS